MTSVDLGLFCLRVGLGVMLMTHSANKVFGSGGLSGTAAWFESLGMRPGALHARMAAGSEFLCGLLVAVGLLTPFAAMGIVALMIVAAATDHRGKGFFVFKGGWEYVGFVGLTAAVVAVCGPGMLSLDWVLELDLAGLPGGLLAVVGGVGAGTAFVLAMVRRPVATE